VENYGTAKQAADNSIIQSMPFAFWITEGIDTHSGYVILFDGNNGYANAPQGCVIPTLPLLF